MYGKTQGNFFDLVGTIDPRVTATAAKKGTIFRFVPSSGDPILLIKEDDGLTTNWIAASGSGSADTASNIGAGQGVFASKVANDFEFKSLVAGSGISLSSSADEITISSTGASVTGDPDTLSYFDASGNLTDNLFAKFDGLLNALSLGSPGQPVAVVASGEPSIAFGKTAIDTLGIFADDSGSLAHGNISGLDAQIRAASLGSHAFGSAELEGKIIASGEGSVAGGLSTGTNSRILTNAAGSFAHGYVENGGLLNAAVEATFALGYVGLNSEIKALTDGSLALGFADNTSVISTNGKGSLAVGVADLGSTIDAQFDGSFAGGVAENNGIINAYRGGIAFGGSLQAGDVLGTADFGQSFGIGNESTSYAAMCIGQYADCTGNSVAFDPEDPLFVAGNGSSNAAKANAFQLDKDGKLLTTGAQVHAAVRQVSADTSLSARTDRSLFVDTATATGNVTVTFPVGEDGLEFFVKDSGGNASVNQILFSASGGDTIEASANITNSRGTRHFQYFSGVWYVMNLP